MKLIYLGYGLSGVYCVHTIPILSTLLFIPALYSCFEFSLLVKFTLQKFLLYGNSTNTLHTNMAKFKIYNTTVERRKKIEKNRNKCFRFFHFSLVALAGPVNRIFNVLPGFLKVLVIPRYNSSACEKIVWMLIRIHVHGTVFYLECISKKVQNLRTSLRS